MSNAGNPFPREIRVYVRDAQRQLLPGAKISFTENGSPRGYVRNAEGHASLTPAKNDSPIEVCVEYEGRAEFRMLAVEQSVCEFVLPDIAPKEVQTVIDNSDNPKSSWSNGAVVAAVITTVGAVLIGYWQFVYKPSHSVSPPTVGTSSPEGTWQVQAQGDPTLQRISSGHVSFSPQPDGQVLMLGRIRMDGVEVSLEGSGSLDHTTVYVHYIATSQVAKWEGDATLRHMDTTHLRGNLTDAKNASTPLLLQHD